MTDDIERRRNLTFSQAEGLAELPRQLERGEMSDAFRIQVWAVIYSSMTTAQGHHGHPIYLEGKWQIIAVRLWVVYFQRPIDELPDASDTYKEFKAVIMDRPYNEVLDFLTALLRCSECSSQLLESISCLLRKCQMAYYLDTSGTPTFIPVSTPEEGKAVRGAMRVVAESGIDGAHLHLRKAAEAINKNQFADAVRESISAVESVAKVISGGEKQTLADALKELETRKLIPHKTLSEVFRKLYGYTSDEKGIRHSLLEDKVANVDEEEALFMFGACASFCGYLCRKQSKIRR